VSALETRWLLVIDRREARIYRSVKPGAPAQVIRAPAPEGFFRAVSDSRGPSGGQEKAEAARFFEPVAGVLNGAGEILIFGDGAGPDSEWARWVVWLQKHRPELAGRIIGTAVIDERQLTEAELLAKARQFFATVRPPPAVKATGERAAWP
jgi:hypothetical protein